jgi:hypothetical protein
VAILSKAYEMSCGATRNNSRRTHRNLRNKIEISIKIIGNKYAPHKVYGGNVPKSKKN